MASRIQVEIQPEDGTIPATPQSSQTTPPISDESQDHLILYRLYWNATFNDEESPSSASQSRITSGAEEQLLSTAQLDSQAPRNPVHDLNSANIQVSQPEPTTVQDPLLIQPRSGSPSLQISQAQGSRSSTPDPEIQGAQSPSQAPAQSPQASLTPASSTTSLPHPSNSPKLRRRRWLFPVIHKRGPIASTKTFNARLTRNNQPPSFWRPPALRESVLAFLGLTSLGFAAVIQYLTIKSGQNQGLLFDPDIKDLPLSTSFSYNYLPTLVSTLYAFIWSWIEIDAKRLEPFYRLLQKQGALGRDSLLLHYPVDFLATVPFNSLRRR
jgi:hypothetical protein